MSNLPNRKADCGYSVPTIPFLSISCTIGASFTLRILAQVVRVLAADAVGLEEFGGHGVFQLPDHGDGALAGIGNLRTAA